jgi:hypothetical protein
MQGRRLVAGGRVTSLPFFYFRFVSAQRLNNLVCIAVVGRVNRRYRDTPRVSHVWHEIIWFWFMCWQYAQLCDCKFKFKRILGRKIKNQKPVVTQTQIRHYVLFIHPFVLSSHLWCSLRIQWTHRRVVIHLNTTALQLMAVRERQRPAALGLRRRQPQPEQMPPRCRCRVVLVGGAGVQ